MSEEEVKLNVGGVLIIKNKTLLSSLKYFEDLFERWYASDTESSRTIDLSDRDPIAFLKIIKSIEKSVPLSKKYIDELKYYGGEEYIQKENNQIKDETIYPIIKNQSYENGSTTIIPYDIQTKNNFFILEELKRENRAASMYRISKPLCFIECCKKYLNKEIISIKEKHLPLIANVAIIPSSLTPSEDYHRHKKWILNPRFDAIRNIQLVIHLKSLNHGRYVKHVGYHIINNISIEYDMVRRCKISGTSLLIKNLLEESCDTKFTFGYDDVNIRQKETKKGVCIIIDLKLPSLFTRINSESFKILNLELRKGGDIVILDESNFWLSSNEYDIEHCVENIHLRAEHVKFLYTTNDPVAITKFERTKFIYKQLNENSCTETVYKKCTHRPKWAMSTWNRWPVHLFIIAQFQHDLDGKNYSNFGVYRDEKGDLKNVIDHIIFSNGNSEFVDTNPYSLWESFPYTEYENMQTQKRLYNTFVPSIFCIDMESSFLSHIPLADIAITIYFKTLFSGTLTIHSQYKLRTSIRNGMEVTLDL